MKIKLSNEKEKNQRVLLFMSYFMLWFFLHLLCRRYGDDVLAMNNPYSSFSEFVESYVEFISKWSSRFIIDFFGKIIQRIPMDIWRLLDSIIITFMVSQLDQIFNKERNIKITIYIMSCFFVYPFVHMSTAGWMSTTFTYLWSAAFLFYVVKCWIRMCNGETLRKRKYIALIFAYLYAIDHQQVSVAAVIISIAVFIVIILQKKKKESFYMGVMSIISISRTLVHLLWKGNENRNVGSIAPWFPDFEMQSTLDKIQAGFSYACKNLFLSGSLVFALLTIAMTIVVFMKYKDIIHRGISLVPTMVVMLWGPLKNWGQQWVESVYFLDDGYETLYGMINNRNRGSFSAYGMLFIFGVCLICMLSSVVAIYKETSKVWLYGALLPIGIGSTMVMGFSPTIAGSAQRTLLVLYLSSIVLLIAFGKEIILKSKHGHIWSGVLLTLGILMYVNNVINAYLVGM